MLKNSFLERYKIKSKRQIDYEKYILSQNNNYLIDLERPLSQKNIKNFPDDKLQIFIDDIMCNKKVNDLLYSGNSKKELYIYLKQKNSLLKNTKFTDSIDPAKMGRKLRPCESVFLKKKKIIMFDIIRDSISNFKLKKSMSMYKLKEKNKEFYKHQISTEKISNKLYFKPVNDTRYNGYQRSLKTCLEKSKSDPEFSLPDVELKLNDVYSRLYHNMIYYPIHLDTKNRIKKNKKKIKIFKNININNNNNLNNSRNNNINISNVNNNNNTNFEENKKIPKLKISNLFREYGGKEFLLKSTFSNRNKCWRKNSGGPFVKGSYSDKINLNKFKKNKSKEKYCFYIGQVPAASYNDSNYWNNLTYVENRNVTCNNGNCTFTWKEIKQSENNYIFIVPPSPFEEFYSKYGRKIKISHKGGLSSGAIAALIIGCSCLVGAIVTIILCRRCYYKDKNYILTSAPSSSYGRPMIELGNHTSPLPYYNRGY